VPLIIAPARGVLFGPAKKFSLGFKFLASIFALVDEGSKKLALKKAGSVLGPPPPSGKIIGRLPSQDQKIVKPTIPPLRAEGFDLPSRLRSINGWRPFILLAALRLDPSAC
jgi:hypothetical protein